MTFESVLELINNHLLTQRGKGLTTAEKCVVQAAWEEKEYRLVAEHTPYTESYLKCRVGPELWKTLSEALGEDISKRNFRRFWRWWEITHPFSGRPNAPEAENPLPFLPVSQPVVVGGALPDLSNLVGRHDLDALAESIDENRCVVLSGFAGAGKTILAAMAIQYFIEQNTSRFEKIIWRATNPQLSFTDFMTDLLSLMGVDAAALEQSSLKFTLINQLRQQRCLIVLDGAELLLQDILNNRTAKPGELLSEYLTLFEQIIGERSQSCMLITSQEQLPRLNKLEERCLPICNFRSNGFSNTEAHQFLRSKGLTGQENWQRLIDENDRNPFQLEEVSRDITRFFGGNVTKYLEFASTLLISSGPRSMLEYQFEKRGLNEQERQILGYLANQAAQTPVNFTDLLVNLKGKADSRMTMAGIRDAILSLEDRSLINTSKDPDTNEDLFSLGCITKKYIQRNQAGAL